MPGSNPTFSADVERAHRRVRSRIVIASLIVLASGVLFVGGVIMWPSGGSVGPSQLPSLPGDIEIVQDITDHNARAGGAWDRALVLHSSSRSPEQILTEVKSAMDSDPSWAAKDDRSWWLRGGSSTVHCESAVLSIEDPGEMLLAEGSLQLSARSAVLVLGWTGHRFDHCPN